MSDSFDSADPLFSTAGRYDPAKRRDGGDIASYAGLTIRAPSEIAGKVWTGPEAVVSLLGSSASVGSLAWVDSVRTGIQPGYWSTNLQESWPDIRVPYVAGMVPARGTVEGEFYDYVFENGDYRMDSLRLATGKYW